MPSRATPPPPLRVPWATLLKIAAAVLAAWVCLRLWPSVELLLFAALIAIALSPVVRTLERRRVTRGRAVLLLALAVVLLGGAFAFFVLPPLMAQVSAMWKGLPAIRASISRSLESGGLSARVLLPLLDLPHGPEVDAWLARPLVWGPPAFEAAGGAVVVVVLSLYLLLDGPKVVAWLLAYAPRAHRRKMGDMVPELFAVVQAYTTGQLVASALFGAFALVVISASGVPGALPIAFLAALCDVIPVAGIVIVTVGRRPLRPHRQPDDGSRRRGALRRLSSLRALRASPASLRQPPAALDADRPPRDPRRAGRSAASPAPFSRCRSSRPTRSWKSTGWTSGCTPMPSPTTRFSARRTTPGASGRS